MNAEATIAPSQRVPAGFWIRGAAFIIDFLIVNVSEFLVEYGIARLLGLEPMGEQILDGALTIGFYFYYYCIYQVKHQGTPGKKWLGLELIRNDGKPLTKGGAMLRLLGYLISFLMMGCGFLMAAFHPEKKSFHDLICGTSVVEKSKS
ncbi:MAG: RDD family protein [Bdellovibrionales bacterium]|nr:RDD family protein [Bdellovibrionales bacterium]